MPELAGVSAPVFDAVNPLLGAMTLTLPRMGYRKRRSRRYTMQRRR